MPREAGIEDHFIRSCERMGWSQKKEGHDGWPDRLVFHRPKQHFWVELKQPDGTLTAAQRVRIPILVLRGETVLFFDKRSDIDTFCEVLR